MTAVNLSVNNDMSLSWDVGGAYNVSFNGAWPGTGLHMFVVAFDASNSPGEWSLYIDGILHSTVDDNQRPGFVGDTTLVNLGTIHNAATSYMEATYFLLGSWIGRAMTPSDVVWLWNEPYSFMEPIAFNPSIFELDTDYTTKFYRVR